jgi:rod shape-determining protein MreD
MSQRLKFFLFVLLLTGQIMIGRYQPLLRLSVDLIYLIIFYQAVKGGFYRGILAGALLGLLTDYFTGGVIGVFSFSRTLAAYLIGGVSRFIDYRKNSFIFAFLFGTLWISNAVANIFFQLAFRFHFSAQLLLWQPLLTALVGTILVGTNRAKALLDVY